MRRLARALLGPVLALALLTGCTQDGATPIAASPGPSPSPTRAASSAEPGGTPAATPQVLSFEPRGQIFSTVDYDSPRTGVPLLTGTRMNAYRATSDRTGGDRRTPA